MIKNYEDFVNENNLQKTRVMTNSDKGLDEDVYRKLDEDVYESLLGWIATIMEEYREMFNDDDRLCKFIRFQLEAASETLDEKCDVDSTIKYYCR